MGRRVFVTVAEVSGDQHAGPLISAMRRLDPGVVVEGHGGEEMRAAGAVIHRETTQKAAMMHHAIGRTREVLSLLRWTRTHFQQHRPDLHICIDSWAMNVHFAKLAHSFGVPVLYYIAPQVWASREGRLRTIRRYVDRVACILPFEEEYYRRHDIEATYVGHPLFDELPPERNGHTGERFPNRPPVIGLVAGSRESVAKQNFPSLLQVAEKLRERFPEATFLVPTKSASHALVSAMAAGMKGITIQQDAFDQMIPQCDLCLTVSGTATLHVAAYGVPMVVVYRGNPLLWHLIGRWIVKTRTYSLVNLLSDYHEHIVPEFVPWYGPADPVADVATDFLRHPEKLSAQREKLQHLIRTLDRPGASMNAARLAVGMLGDKLNEAPLLASSAMAGQVDGA